MKIITPEGYIGGVCGVITQTSGGKCLFYKNDLPSEFDVPDKYIYNILRFRHPTNYDVDTFDIILK